MTIRSVEFLAEQPGPRPWEVPGGGRGGFNAADLFLGNGANPLEVVVAIAGSRPNVSDVRQLWKRRKANRPSPVLLVVLHMSGDGARAAVCGPVGEDPPVHTDLDAGQVERLASAALAEPNRNAAIRFLVEALPEAESELPGLRNQGMFATHELREGVPRRPDWEEMSTRGRPALAERGRNLVSALGFTIDELSASTSVLRVSESGTKAAVAVFLDASETPDGTLERFGGTSPVGHALEKADSERLPYVVLTRGTQIRVYAAGRDVGVGRQGRAETFIEANLALLPDDQAGYLPLLFGAPALRAGGTFEQVLEQSRDFSFSLGERLRDRIYIHVVPQLATAIASHHAGEPTEEQLADLYEQAMVVLFRLLFVAYAEDKDLLPYRQNGLYQRNALKTLARDLADVANGDGDTPDFDPSATDLWSKATSLWRAIDRGNRDWGVPEYNGGMFSTEPGVNPAGSAIDQLELANSEIGPAMFWLITDADTEGRYGPVDFRSLSVREFGTIYEGLLESSLAFAETDLTLDADGTYVPADGDDEIEVEAGDIYLHDRSGTRKATGSYFTKPFAVAHLLDHAVEPALDDHLQRLAGLIDSGNESEAAGLFFDFRVADIAMGSGHFLVAAVDHIETRLSNFLATHPIPGVLNELERLRATARENLGELADAQEIEDASLLRRQIARRCVYGVDLNLIAVELARLAMWIHTFVPGLPLSFLDHNLVEGNSLTGIGSVDEAAIALDELSSRRTGGGGTSAFGRVRIEERLGEADEALSRLARSSDASAAEIRQARDAHLQAAESVIPVKRLFDLLVADRLGEVDMPYDDVEGVPDDVLESGNLLVGRAAAFTEELQALHFPIAFPEVFLRDRPGFDVIVGNPPWDKVRFEAQQYWVTRAPGLNSLSANDRDARIEALRSERPRDHEQELIEMAERSRLQEAFSASYRLQGRSHHDYAKLFLERALALGNDDFRLGFVLPRQMLVLRGWAKLREALLENAAVRVVQARNKAGWLFDDVDHRFMVVLVERSWARGEESAVTLWGAVKSVTQFMNIRSEDGLTIDRDDLSDLSDTLVVPWLNDVADAALFEKIRRHPRLGSPEGWIEAYSEDRWDFSGSGRHRSLAVEADDENLWHVLMARHVDQYAINTQKSFQRSVTDIDGLIALANGVERVNGESALDQDHPVIAYRYPSINDNARTMIATALPSCGFLPSKGYVHSIRCPGASLPAQFALVGLLNSYACDWWVRRFVDRHVTAPVVRNLRLPEWSSSDVDYVSRLVQELLRRGGTEEVAGGQAVSTFEEFATMSHDQIIVAIEVVVAQGYGLIEVDYQRILDDFSQVGCPLPLREAILNALR